MPTDTDLHGIDKPLGNENFTRAAYNTVLDQIDSAIRGITPMTTATRDALTAAQKWTGRVIWNTTASEYQRWTGVAWTTDVLAPYVLDAEKGAASGVATLGVDGILTASQRPPIDKSRTITALAGATALTSAHDVVVCNGTFTVTLPAAASVPGKIFDIKNIGTGVITVDANAAETVDDATTFVLSARYDSITIVSDGAEWWVI